MTGPSTTNPLATFMNGLAYAMANGGEKAVELYITTQIPFLSNPFLQYLLDTAVQDLGGAIVKQGNIFVDYLIYDFQTNAENSTLYQAMSQLQTAMGGNANASTQAAKDAWKNLINWDGSAVP